MVKLSSLVFAVLLAPVDAERMESVEEVPLMQSMHLAAIQAGEEESLTWSVWPWSSKDSAQKATEAALKEVKKQVEEKIKQVEAEAQADYQIVVDTVPGKLKALEEKTAEVVAEETEKVLNSEIVQKAEADGQAKAQEFEAFAKAEAQAELEVAKIEFDKEVEVAKVIAAEKEKVAKEEGAIKIAAAEKDLEDAAAGLLHDGVELAKAEAPKVEDYALAKGSEAVKAIEEKVAEVAPKVGAAVEEQVDTVVAKLAATLEAKAKEKFGDKPVKHFESEAKKDAAIAKELGEAALASDVVQGMITISEEELAALMKVAQLHEAELTEEMKEDFEKLRAEGIAQLPTLQAQSRQVLMEFLELCRREQEALTPIVVEEIEELRAASEAKLIILVPQISEELLETLLRMRERLGLHASDLHAALSAEEVRVLTALLSTKTKQYNTGWRYSVAWLQAEEMAQAVAAAAAA